VVLAVLVCVCSSACWVYRRQRSDEFQRTRTLSSQLHLSQRKVQQLEAELTRIQLARDRVLLWDMSSAADATGLVCA